MRSPQSQGDGIGNADRRSLQKDTPHSNLRFRTHNAYAAVVVCGFLLLAVALVFGQTVGDEFVHYDDRQYMFENPVAQKGLTLQGFRWVFTTGHASNWHPLKKALEIKPDNANVRDNLDLLLKLRGRQEVQTSRANSPAPGLRLPANGK